jgi:MerR family transcriptional regulator, light-induced transcriptional regulator
MLPDWPSGTCSPEEYRVYLNALLEGDRRTCGHILRSRLEAGAGIRGIYEDLVGRSLYEVGERWAQGEISVAREHLASTLSESLLSEVYPRVFARPWLGRRAIVTSMANEFHQIGGKMVADIFELNGWRGDFLGANTPLEDLLEFVARRQTDVVAFSLTLEANLGLLEHAVETVRREHPGLPILVGGQAFRSGGGDRIVREGVSLLTDLGALEQWIRDAS